MKTKLAKSLVCFAVAGFFLSASAFAAPLDLSVFKGNYKGTTTVSGPNPTQTGKATVNFAVPSLGTSGRVNYKVILENVQVTSFALNPNKQALVTDLLVGIAGANNAKRGKGPWSQNGRTVRFTATNGEGTTLRCTASVREFPNRRQLTLTLVSDDGVDATTFRSVLRAPLP